MRTHRHLGPPNKNTFVTDPYTWHKTNLRSSHATEHLPGISWRVILFLKLHQKDVITYHYEFIVNVRLTFRGAIWCKTRNLTGNRRVWEQLRTNKRRGDSSKYLENFSKNAAECRNVSCDPQYTSANLSLLSQLRTRYALTLLSSATEFIHIQYMHPFAQDSNNPILVKLVTVKW